MAKTEATLDLEKKIHKATCKQGVFCCFEVTIGWYGEERVDYMTYDTKGIFRCYEIKVTKSDFHSKAHNSFVGQYNYYVMTSELYEQVKDEIPNNVGVYIGGWCIKKSKKVQLTVDVNILKDSFIRCLSRDAEKIHKIENPNLIGQLKSKIKKLEEDKSNYQRRYSELYLKGRAVLGAGWDDDVKLEDVFT